MLDVVGKKSWYFAFSLIILLPGLVAIVGWGLNMGIDFTGGSLVEVKFGSAVDRKEIQQAIEKAGVEVSSIAPTQENTYLVRTKPLEEKDRAKMEESLKVLSSKSEIISLQTIGPTIGQELLQKSATALFVASLAIVLYIAWAFRRVPRPASSWRFGVAAIVALLHDALLVLGSFAILGKLFAAPIDSLFVTALLTVIGFSVHDTIVVFDRIRENLNNKVGESFASIVNHSIMQTMTRSINTSFTVVLVLLPILLFGGTSLHWFTIALLIGIISGTYSSIFIASPILVLWQDWSEKRRK